MTTIFITIAILFLVLISKLRYDSKQHYKWFLNLKPGDKVYVQIFSQNCECLKEAIITSTPVGSYVEANIIDVDKCKSCALLNSKETEESEPTCWYQVSRFYKHNVVKYERPND